MNPSGWDDAAMSEMTLPATVPCPGCGEPADQVWCDVTGPFDAEPRFVPGEVTCHNEGCAFRARRQAELDWIEANGNVWRETRGPWWRRMMRR